MNAEYPLSHAYFERAIFIGPGLKQPVTALISKCKVSDTDDERSVYTGIQTVSVIWKLWVSSFFLCKFLSYIRPPVDEPKILNSHNGQLFEFFNRHKCEKKKTKKKKKNACLKRPLTLANLTRGRLRTTITYDFNTFRATKCKMPSWLNYFRV